MIEKATKSTRKNQLRKLAAAGGAALILSACSTEDKGQTAQATCEKVVDRAPITSAKTLDAYMRGVGACFLKLQEVMPQSQTSLDHLIELPSGDTVAFQGPVNDAEAWSLKVQDTNNHLPLGVGGLRLDGAWQGHVTHDIGQASQTDEAMYSFRGAEKLTMTDESLTPQPIDPKEAWQDLQALTNAQITKVVAQL